jgi:hypothetical protein
MVSFKTFNERKQSIISTTWKDKCNRGFNHTFLG